MSRFLFVFLVLGSSILAYSQDADSITYVPDSADVQFTDDEDLPDSTAPPDSSDITVRDFDRKSLDDLKSDPSLQYKEPPTIAESLWDRFLIWLNQFWEALFQNAIETNWGRVLTYVIGIVVIIVLIMMVLKVNAFKVFYSGHGADNFRHQVFDENIHEMDFEKLIQEAIAQNDYRTGVRLVFLCSLKMLSDKNLIHWDQGKTNHDYINELKAPDLKTGFNELNYYFEYAWYGDFEINREVFSRMQLIFDDWKQTLRKSR